MTTPIRYSATVVQRPRIDGVKVKPLRSSPTSAAGCMEILRADDSELFTQFGQVYVSATYPGVVKAWHYHEQQMDNFACVAGMVKLVLVDTRATRRPTAPSTNSSSACRTRMLVQVPNLVYHGWKCISVGTVARHQRA